MKWFSELRELRVRPIAAGILVDQVSTFLFGFLYLLLRMSLIAAMGGDASAETLASLTLGEELTMFAAGTMMTGLGAYIAARMAGRAHMAHGLAVGAAALALTLLLELFPPSPPPALWMRLLSIVIVLPAGALGGSFARAHDRATEDAETTR